MKPDADSSNVVNVHADDKRKVYHGITNIMIKMLIFLMILDVGARYSCVILIYGSRVWMRPVVPSL